MAQPAVKKIRMQRAVQATEDALADDLKTSPSEEQELSRVREAAALIEVR